MEISKFMEKTLALARSSRQYIDRLWKMELDVSKFGASIASIRSSIFDTLVKAVMRVVSLSREVRGLSLTRFMFLPRFDLWSRRVTSPEEEYFQTEMGRANVSFLFNVTVARKIAAKLAKRATAKTPKPLLLPRAAPLPEAELMEEIVEEDVEEPAKTVPHIVADLQSRFASKLAPSIKGIALALQEYGNQTILLAPLLASPKKEVPQVGLLGRTLPAQVEEPRPDVVSPLEYATKLPSIILEQEIPILEATAAFSLVSPPKPPLPILSERSLAVISQVPYIPHKEAEVEPPPLISIPVVRLRPLASRSFGYATKLPSIILEQEIPILEATAAFSLVSPPRVRAGVEPSYRYPKATTLPPMRPSQMGRLIEEISPSLTSWIYGVSEILRGTALSLSAVPVAASTAERVVTETLLQPVSSFEAPRILGTQEPVSLGLAPSRPETGVGRIEVEAFRLPAIVASLVFALSQRYPLLFSEPTISETYGASYELTPVTPEETPALGGIPEVKSFSKLPTVIALAAAESLIAHRLQREFSALATEIQVSRSSYGERLEELGAFGPSRPTMLGKLAALAPAAPLSSALEPYAPQIPSRSPPLTRLGPGSPAVPSTFNITLSAESTEEDLRDLERKINRILSEQIRRYYGSPRI